MNRSTSRMLACCLAVVLTVGTNFAVRAQRAPLPMPPGTNPEVVNTYNEGSRAIQSGRVGEAAERFKSVVAAVPQFAPAHTGYGVALARLGRNGEALAEFEKAYSIMPDDGQTLVQLAQMLGLVGRTNEALKYYKQYLSLYPNGHDAAMMRQNLDILQQQTASSSAAVSSDSSVSETAAKTHNTVLKWSQMPIPVFIANGAGVSGYRPEFQSILTESFNAWANASQGRISVQFVNNPGAALVRCKWTADAKEVSTPQEGGHTLINTTASGTIKLAELVILTHELQQPTLPVNENALRWTCLHEVGHALGLAAHSNQPGDIMFLGATGDRGNALALSERDKKTIFLLYSR